MAEVLVLVEHAEGGKVADRGSSCARRSVDGRVHAHDLVAREQLESSVRPPVRPRRPEEHQPVADGHPLVEPVVQEGGDSLRIPVLDGAHDGPGFRRAGHQRTAS